MGNLVAIVGRPNVGKSTLFNRLTKSRKAIVSDEAGTTRDRQYGKCEWNGREFSVVDTGGWVVNSDDIFEEQIRKQVIIATEEADLVLFLVDVNSGLTSWDEDVAMILRRTKLPVILVVNKVDNYDQYSDATEFYKLGLGDYFCISSATGSGTGDLLDAVLTHLKPDVADDLAHEARVLHGRPAVLHDDGLAAVPADPRQGLDEDLRLPERELARPRQSASHRLSFRLRLCDRKEPRPTSGSLR